MNAPNLEFELQNLQLNLTASDWRTAIVAAAQPLVEHADITPTYVHSMIAAVEELGPYIVIAPGLALGHSRPSPSVLHNAFSIATFSDPIKFGNKDNDLVDIVVILASTSNTNHLSLLQKLVLFLNDAAHIKLLRQATTQADRETIVRAINEEISSIRY